MTPETIRQLFSDGVTLTLSPDGAIKVSGDAAAVKHWTPAIREHRAEIIELLRAPLPEESGLAIMAWLDSIGEVDAVVIAEVLAQCQANADARNYFLGRAAAELPKPVL
jgi:hypothetical protein